MAFGIAAERLPRERKTPDFILVSCFVLLLGLGLSMLFSASYYRADFLFNNPFYFIKSQLLYAGVGLAAALCAAFVTMALVRSLIPILMIFSIILMLLTFIPGIGVEYLGARRWIQLAGYTLQPAELVRWFPHPAPDPQSRGGFFDGLDSHCVD